jgi:hypothetical protein
MSLVAAVAAVVVAAVYEVVAVRTGRVPTYCAMERAVRVHCRPHCPTCGEVRRAVGVDA